MTAPGHDEAAFGPICREVAEGCRVLAHRGLSEDVLGHISVRVDDGRALVRCRGPQEAGLRFTLTTDIRVVDLASGRIVDDPDGIYAPPSELPIHTAVLHARPDVQCVVHCHPPDVVAVGAAGLPLVPLFGAYNIPAMRLVEQGLPVHPRSVLIHTPDLAAEMVESLGAAPAVVLAGHGLVTTGTSVADAVLRALHIDTLARLTLAVHRVGRRPRPIDRIDREQLPDLGDGFNQHTLWRHHLASLDADGWGLPTC